MHMPIASRIIKRQIEKEMIKRVSQNKLYNKIRIALQANHVDYLTCRRRRL